MTVGTPRSSTAGRIIGIALLVVGVVGVIVAIVGIVAGIQVVNGVGAAAQNVLSLTSNSLNTAKVTAEQAQVGIQQVQGGLDVLETTIVDAGNTVSQSDATLTALLTTLSKDVPDTIDNVQAAIPPAAEAAKSVLGNVQAGMEGASAAIEQNGPLVNQAFTTISQDVPNTIDYWSSAIGPNAEGAHNFLANVKTAMVTTGDQLQQADAAWKQGVSYVSNDVPNTIDYWNSAIPPNVALWQSYLNSAQGSLDQASLMASQADAVLDQTVKVASEDMPNSIDYWRGAISPTADLWKSYVSGAEASLMNASATANRADLLLNQAVQVASQDVPNTIDAWNAVIPANADLWKSYVNAAQANLMNASAMAAQADAVLNQAVKVTSEDVPNSIDAWNAVIPANADLWKAYVSSVEASLMNASQTTAQADAALSQAVQVASQDVPNSIDAWNAVIPANAQLWKAYVSNVEANLMNASQVAAAADASLKQVIKVTSVDVPNSIDAWNAVIPANAQVLKAYLGSLQQALDSASTIAAQADATLDQAVKITSQDLPNTIDYWNALIPPNAELWKAYVNGAQAAMVNASALASQADVALDQAVKVTSVDVPNSIDAWNAVIPPNAEAAQSVLTNLENSVDWARYGVDQSEVALDLTTQVVPDTLDQLNAYLTSMASATEGNINGTLAMLHQLNYLDATYRVRLDQSAKQLSANLDYLSNVVRSAGGAFDGNLQAADQGLAVLSDNAKLLNQQIDQYALITGQLAQVSQQLRALEPAYQNNVDLEAVSQYLLALSQNATLINSQIDQLVAMSGQLDQLSRQLRTLEPAYQGSVDLNALSQYLAALAQNTAVLKAQVDPLAALTSQQLTQLSQQLRTLGPAYEQNVNLAAWSQYLEALAQQTGAVNPQIDQLAALASQQLDMVSQQLRTLGPAYEQNVNLAAWSQYLEALAQQTGAINPQIDQLAGLASQQLDLTSQQLRAVGPLYHQNVDLGAWSQYLEALAQQTGAINPQIDQLAALSSQQLDLTSQQLRALGPLYHQNVDLAGWSQYLAALAQNTAAINPQIDQLAALSDQQLALVSQQLRALGPAYQNSGIDLNATSQYLAGLSQNVAAVNSQLDQVSAVTDQLAQVSQQLRALEAYSNIGIGDAGKNLQAMTAYVDLADQQVSNYETAVAQMQQWANGLRALEPYANIDYGAISQQILDLSSSLPAVSGQIDQLVAMSGQMGQVSSSLRSLAPLADTDFNAIGQDISGAASNVTTVKTQLDQFSGMADQFIASVDSTNANISQIQTTLNSRLSLIKVGIVIFMLWLLLAQLAPLYLGWVLLSGRMHYVRSEV
jgi:hypothetical protein